MKEISKVFRKNNLKEVKVMKNILFSHFFEALSILSCLVFQNDSVGQKIQLASVFTKRKWCYSCILEYKTVGAHQLLYLKSSFTFLLF